MPRKTRTTRQERTAPCPAPKPGALLLAALGGLEEDGELLEVVLAEVCERRHGRARICRARVLEVLDLEVDALPLGAFRRQVGGAEVRRAGAEVRVARETGQLREGLGALL